MDTSITKKEIIQLLKEHWGDETNVDFAKRLGSTRQSINKYINVGNGERVDIQRLIILALMDELGIKKRKE